MTLAKHRHGTTISGVAANAAEALRTGTLTGETMARARRVGVYVKLVKDGVTGTATELIVTGYKSCDGGATWGVIPALAAQGDGTSEPYDYSIKKTQNITGTIELHLTFDVEDADAFKYIVAATGGGGGDVITSKACSSYERR